VAKSACGRAIANALEKILAAAPFSVDDRDAMQEALEAYRNANGDFADHVVGVRNRNAGCRETVTFDQGLKKSRSFSTL
jgi:predicted nucleic-acid-binding protein